MKKRIFYVINLDRSRIITISLLFGAFICASFISGFHMGTNKSGVPLYNAGGNVSYLNQNNYGLPVNNDIESENDNGSQYGKNLTRISQKSPDEESGMAENEPQTDTSKGEIEKSEKKSVTKKSTRRIKQVSDNENKKEEKTKRARVTHKESQIKSNNNSKSKKSESSRQKNNQISEMKKEKKSDTKESANPKSPLLGSSNAKLSAVEQSETVSGKNNSYTLQVGAFNNKETADRMKLQLAKDGFNAYIISKGDQHRVRVGRDMNEEKMITMESQLKSKKFGSVRIKE